MQHSSELEKALDQAIDELLLQDGREALFSIMLIITRVLGWSSFKLREQNETELCDELLSVSASLERLVFDRLDMGSQACNRASQHPMK